MDKLSRDLAEFCRRHETKPESVKRLIAEIGRRNGIRSVSAERISTFFRNHS